MMKPDFRIYSFISEMDYKETDLAVYQCCLTIANKVGAFNVKCIFNIKILRLDMAKGFPLRHRQTGVVMDGAGVVIAMSRPWCDISFIIRYEGLIFLLLPLIKGRCSVRGKSESIKIRSK